MHEAIRVTSLYAIFASCWILFSDRIIELFSVTIVQMGLFSTLKGLAFVIATSILLFLLIKREFNEKNLVIAELGNEAKIRNQLITELHHRIKNNLQTVLGLLNLEAAGGDTVEHLKETMTGRLLSMSAIFNIVYDMRDMRNVMLQRVLEEYRSLRHDRIVRMRVNPHISYNIETITSCLLVIDAISDRVLERDPAAEFELIMEERGMLGICVTGNAVYDALASIGNNGFILSMLDSIKGTLKMTQGSIDIVFSEIPEARSRVVPA
jgi:hypothetical protein